MQFRDTTNRTGIVELLEDLTNTQTSSTSSYTLATKTRDINDAYSSFQMMASQYSGTWQSDDTNHSDYAEMYGSLVLGQQDYTFTEDENGNQVQDIFRVECKDANGNWQLLTRYDENDETTALEAQATFTGTPNRYYLTANGIFLDRTPSYNSTNGLKIYFSRSPSFFTTSDTTKEPGIPLPFHRYLAYLPAYWYWLPRDSNKASLYKSEVDRLELQAKTHYSKRTRDIKPRLVVKQRSCR